MSSQKPIPQSLCVLHVHSGNLFGGVERAILTCVDNLQFAPSLRFEFALCFEGKFAESLRRAGQSVHRLPEVRVRNPLSILSARRKLLELLERSQYHAIVCHAPWSRSVFAPAFVRSRLPELFWAHDYFSGRHWLEKWASRTPPAFVISNSHYTDASLPKLFPGVLHEVIYCPVDMAASKSTAKQRTEIRSVLQTQEDAIVLLQVSRLEPRKGHSILLKAASELRTQQKWCLWFVGGAQRPEESRYLHSLKHQAEELRIADRVRFTGERTDIPQLMAAADVFCQPNSIPEPFGIVFVEALSAGLPVLTFAMGGPAEIVDETCGILVSPGNVAGLAAELQRLVCDDDLRYRLGAGGPTRARAISDPARILPALENVIVRTVRSYASRKA